MHKEKILVVDDDENFRNLIRVPLTKEGFYVETIESGVRAAERIKETYYDLILTDLMMEGMSGLDLLKEIKKFSPDTIVLMITAHGSLQTAIEATKLGAYDYIEKPCSTAELLLKVQHGLERKRYESELKRLKDTVGEKYEFCNIISKNAQMRKIFDLIEQIAQTDITVLITGDTGTGKEMIAKSVHFNSVRKDKPFMIVNCAALTETLLESELFGHEKGAFTGAFKQKLGRFELADGGTVFLDEIGDIPLATQVKLLRVLQEREFERVGGTEVIKCDIRIIGATNKKLEKLIKEEKFREDLYYRVNVFPIYLPPLRDRKDDIPLLGAHFLKKYSKQQNKEIESISPEAMDILMNYDWPGNIRELENVMERATLLETGKVLQKVGLEEQLKITSRGKEKYFIDTTLTYKEYMRNIIAEAERKYILAVLKHSKGNIRMTADKVGLDRKTVYRKIKEYGIKKEEYKKQSN